MEGIQRDSTLIETLKKTITLEESKAIITDQYLNKDNPLELVQEPRIPGKRAFAAKRDFLANVVNRKLHQQQEAQKEEEKNAEPTIEEVYEIPPLPLIPVSPFVLNPISASNIDIDHLETSSYKLNRDLDDFQRIAVQISGNVVQLESIAIDCKQLAELSRVMSDSSVQQLKQIQEIHDRHSLFAQFLTFFKNFFGFQSM